MYEWDADLDEYEEVAPEWVEESDACYGNDDEWDDGSSTRRWPAGGVTCVDGNCNRFFHEINGECLL